MAEVSKISFGKIYVSRDLKEMTKYYPDIKKQADGIKRLLWHNGLHKTKYTDVILDYNGYDGFYGIISSKKQGVPINPEYRSPSITKTKLTDFIEWLQGWEESYNPKTIKK